MIAGSIKKQAVLLAGCTVLAGAMGLMTAQTAHAAQATTPQSADGACVKQVANAGVPVSKFDYNKDSVADAVSWTVTSKGDYSTSMTLNIGTASKKIINTDFDSSSVYLLKLDNDKTYVYVVAQAESDYVVCSKVYYLNANGKIAVALDMQNKDISFLAKNSSEKNNVLTTVNGNKLVVSCEAQPYGCGVITYSYTYKSTKNGFKRTKAATAVSPKFSNGKKTVKASPITANVTAYKTVAAKKKQTVAIPSGTTVKVKGAYFTKKLKLLKVSYTVNKVTTTAYIDLSKYKSTKSAVFKYAKFAA